MNMSADGMWQANKQAINELFLDRECCLSCFVIYCNCSLYYLFRDQVMKDLSAAPPEIQKSLENVGQNMESVAIGVPEHIVNPL